MSSRQSHAHNRAERGQALIEYALILVLVGVAFSIAFAATRPAVEGVFERAVDDIIGQTRIAGDIPGREEFWLTVTAAFENPPRDRVAPTNTPAPPTQVPTDGPSPTPTETFTPSPVQPTATPTLTPTPRDRIADAPIRDTVDNPEWWRADNNIALGGTPWTGYYFGSTNPGNNNDAEHVQFGIWSLDFETRPGSPLIDGWRAENWSARFQRRIRVTQETNLQFLVRADDGVRIFVNGNPVTLRDLDGNTNSWRNQPETFYSGIFTVPANNPADASDTHTVVVEYYNGAAIGRLKVEIKGPSANPDDTYIDNAGNPQPGGGQFACNWGRTDRIGGRDANTEVYMWEEYLDADLPRNSRCYLEWRGAVRISHSDPRMANPQLIYWDVWDFDRGAIGWLEVAEYIPVNPAVNPPVADRAAMNWIRIDRRQQNTSNFNWTRNVINLSDYFDFSDPNGFTLLTFRFVIQNPDNTNVNDRRRWYIDDIEVRGRTENVYLLNREWNLDTAGQRADFITTGGQSRAGVLSGWGLVSNMKLGPSGMAWHDSVGGGDDPTGVAGAGQGTDTIAPGSFTRVRRFSESPNSFNAEDMRIHALEFNGWVDLVNIPEQDSRGNRGEPVLSFYQAYNVGGLTGLAVQYSTDPFEAPNPTWRTFPDGNIRPVTETGEATNLTMQEYLVFLDRNQLVGNPERIRIRWAVMVHRNATLLDGWWIDQIRLGREEDPKWTDYPFSDDAQQFDFSYWRLNGWIQSDEIGRRGVDEPTNPGFRRYSYATTAEGQNYPNSQTLTMELRWPIDLYNNTPNKLFIGKPPTQTSNTFGAPAVHPMLTFYHRRDIAQGDRFLVEWKRVDEPNTAWRTLWLYQRGLGARSTSLWVNSTNNAWEYVEVDMRPILQVIGAPNPANPRNDDIVLRFSLVADGAVNARGVWVDDIRIQEYNPAVYRFWPTDANRNNLFTGANWGNGNGVFFVADPDGSTNGLGWWEAFHRGGDWRAVDWESRTGVLSYHDSPTGGQNRAPFWDWGIPYANGGCCGDVNLGEPVTWTQHPSYSVLELATIIDMRATFQQDQPEMRFWMRHIIGRDDAIRVEVSHELPAFDQANMRTRCANNTVPQCYEHLHGWSRWEEVDLNGNPLWRHVANNNDNMRSNGWTQVRVNLSSYAATVVNPANPAQNTPGRRIRIRFVYDSYNNANNQDGWFIDNVILRYAQPHPPELVTLIGDGQIFDDRSTSMANWIPEGNWGLDATVFQGTGGGPISIGLWNARWWSCGGSGSNPNVSNPSCEAIGQANGASGGNRFRVGADIFLTNPNRPAPDRTQIVPNISYDMGNGSPVAGWVVDRFLGEFTIDTPVVGFGTGFAPGPRTFTTLSDDGVRLKVERYNPVTNALETVPGWPVINNWTDHAPTVDMGTFNFEAGARYRITLQYYENTGGATMILTISSGRFSFSDSPKQGALLPDAMPIPFGNTSLVLNNILNLQGVGANEYVLLEYQTKYRIQDGGATLEVSTDGGYTWQRSDAILRAPVVVNGVTIFPSNSFSETRFTGVFGIDNPASDWQVRRNNLTAYRGENVIIRFRFDRRASRTNWGQPSFCPRRNDCTTNNRDTMEFTPGYYDGWWITAIRVAKF